MSERYKTPDVRQLNDQELPDAAFPAARGGFRVYFDAQTHARIVQHAGEDKSVEICGVLVGRWGQDADGPFVAISQSIRCDDAAKKSGEVTFTHDSWTHINHAMDTRFADLKIVGWYHSHPGFGVFLSERDVFIQEHFFSSPGQVAFVVDPRQTIEGVFAWSNGKPKLCPHYWIGDQVYAAAEQERSSEAGPRERADAAKPLENRPSDYVSLAAIVRGAVPWVAAFLIGYLLAGAKTAWEERRLIEGTVAHFGTWKCLKPGLREHLAEVGADVKRIHAAVNELADQHVKLADEDAADVKARWRQISIAMRDTQENLRTLGLIYGLDPAETAAWKSLFADKIEELGGPVKNKAASKTPEDASPEGKTPDSKTPEGNTPAGKAPSQPAKPDR